MAQSTIRGFSASATSLTPDRVWRIGSAAVCVAAAILIVIPFAIYGFDIGHALLFAAITVLCAIAVLHARFLYLAREQYRQSHDRFLSKEREFQSIFENALDAILVFDDKGVCRDANPSALELLCSRRDGTVGHLVRLYYSDPHDFDALWEALLGSRRHQGEVELVRADGACVFAEFSAAADFLPDRHLMILRNITERRRAQQAMHQSLVLARSSWQEADALRRATLALTEDLRMDRVLDTLLETLARLVPYELAQVLLFETDSRLFLARVAASEKSAPVAGFPEAFDVSDFAVLREVLPVQKGILIEDTAKDKDWRQVGEGIPARSWIGVPLVSSNQILGVLSLVHSDPARFTSEHLRLTGSLAIPAAAAIQNARLYERTEIYGAELERRISELHQVEQILVGSEQGLRASEERFQKLFGSAPVSISVTTLAEGRFIEVNETFEHHFGLSRKELLGRTSIELGFWEHPSERNLLIERLRNGAKVRGVAARLKMRSGIHSTLYSADIIDLDGQHCLLMAIEELPDHLFGDCN